MASFLFQVSVQSVAIAVIWVLVVRDVRTVRERHGSTPAGFSAFAWGALCGLTWIALIPYFSLRRRLDGAAASGPERNLTGWWAVLAVAAAGWAASNLARDDANNGAQHALLAGAFLVCAVVAWERDRKPAAAHP